MQVTAYEIEEKLPKNFYTNIDFEPYIPNKKVLGKKFYTGVDYTLPDSLKNDNYSYVAIKMNDELKKRFYDALIKTPEVFETQSSFNDFFKGIYFKNTHGNGTMLKVGLTRMYFHYRTYHDLDTDGNPLKSSTGADSSYIVDRVKDMIISPEIIQLNSVKHSNVNEAEILNNDTATYVTSPAGYYTVIDVPVGKIMKELVANDADERFLNGVTLNIQAYKPENDDLFSTPPSNMLLVEKSKINEFFEGRKLPDSESYYAASYASDSTSGYWQYNFGNINRLVLSKVKELGYSSYESVPEDITIEMAVVPVSASLNDYGTA